MHSNESGIIPQPETPSGCGKSRKTPVPEELRQNGHPAVVQRLLRTENPLQKSQLLPDQLARRTENLLPKNRQQIQPQNAPFPSHLQSQQPERRLQTCRQRNPFRQPLHRQTPENGSSMKVRQMQPSAISLRQEHQNIRIIMMLFRRKNQNGFQSSEKRSRFSAPHWFPCS